MEIRVLTPAFGLVMAATLAVFVSFGMVIFALPLYARDALERGDAAVGVAVGIASVGAIVAGPLAGRLADRRGRKAVLFGSLAVMLVGYLVLAFEPPFWALVPVRALAGAGEAGAVVATFTMAADLAPEGRRGEAMSLVTVAAYGGLAAGPVVAGALLDGDRFPLVWLAAAGLIALAVLTALAIAETRHEESGAAGWLPPRSALVPGVVLLLALIGFGGFNAFAVLYAREIDVAQPSLVFTLAGLTVVIVRVFGRRIPDRLGPRGAASIACTLVACGLTVVAVWPTEPGLYLGTAIFASGQALAYPSLVLLAMSRAAEAERSATVGAVAAFVDVALATGAFVLGIVADVFDYRGVFLAGAASAAMGLTLLALRVGTARAPAAA